MITKHNECLIKEAIKDWKKGNISELTTIIIIDSIINPVFPTESDIEWARNGSIHNG